MSGELAGWMVVVVAGLVSIWMLGRGARAAKQASRQPVPRLFSEAEIREAIRAEMRSMPATAEEMAERALAALAARLGVEIGETE